METLANITEHARSVASGTIAKFIKIIAKTLFHMSIE